MYMHRVQSAPASPSSTAAAPTAAAAPEPTEVVIRPHGLAHGRWEAPPWAFYTAGGLAVVGALAYALVRLLAARRGHRRPT